MRLQLNRRKLYAIIYMSIADALLIYKKDNEIGIKDKRLIICLKALSKMYDKIIKAMDKRGIKRITNLTRELTKRGKFKKKLDEFDILAMAWFNLYFVEEAFYEIPEIKMPAATAKYYIKEYLKINYYLEGMPELKKRFINIAIAAMKDWNENGFFNIQKQLKKYKEIYNVK